MTSVTENDIVHALHDVPVQEWANVLEFVVSLRATKEEDGTDPPIVTAADLANSDVVGLWADRADIPDSCELRVLFAGEGPTTLRTVSVSLIATLW